MRRLVSTVICIAPVSLYLRIVTEESWMISDMSIFISACTLFFNWLEKHKSCFDEFPSFHLQVRVLFPWIQKSPKHNCFMENIAFDCHSDACSLRSADDMLFIIANLKDLGFLRSESLNMKARTEALQVFSSPLVDTCGHFQMTEHHRVSVTHSSPQSKTQQPVMTVECMKCSTPHTSFFGLIESIILVFKHTYSMEWTHYSHYYTTKHHRIMHKYAHPVSLWLLLRAGLYFAKGIVHPKI